MKKTLNKENLSEKIFTLYRNVKFLREQHGLTTARFAKIINMYEEDLILAEACYAVGFFCDYHIKNICDYFSISPDDLFITKLFETA